MSDNYLSNKGFVPRVNKNSMAKEQNKNIATHTSVKWINYLHRHFSKEDKWLSVWKNVLYHILRNIHMKPKCDSAVLQSEWLCASFSLLWQMLKILKRESLFWLSFRDLMLDFSPWLHHFRSELRWTIMVAEACGRHWPYHHGTVRGERGPGKGTVSKPCTRDPLALTRPLPTPHSHQLPMIWWLD